MADLKKKSEWKRKWTKLTVGVEHLRHNFLTFC
jgi:hypothetical protein